MARRVRAKSEEPAAAVDADVVAERKGWVQVVMRSTYAGPFGTCAAGGMMVMPPERASSLVKAGYATLVRDMPEPETAG